MMQFIVLHCFLKNHIHMLRSASDDASRKYLSNMLMGTNLGTKLVSDAKQIVDERSVDGQLVQDLDAAFAKLPKSYADLHGESSLKPWILVIEHSNFKMIF